MKGGSGIDGVKNTETDEKPAKLATMKKQVDVHQYLNTLLVPIVGFLLWNKVSDIETDISKINSRLDEHVRVEETLDNRIQALEDSKKSGQVVSDRLTLEAVMPNERKK